MKILEKDGYPYLCRYWLVDAIATITKTSIPETQVKIAREETGEKPHTKEYLLKHINPKLEEHLEEEEEADLLTMLQKLSTSGSDDSYRRITNALHKKGILDGIVIFKERENLLRNA